MLDASNEEDSLPAASATKESKKRKVAFVESSTRGVEPGDVAEVPRRKKRKGDGDSAVDSAVAEAVSSYITMKKGKTKAKDASPIPEVNYDSPGHTGTMGVSITRGDPVEDSQLAELEPSSPGDPRQQSELTSKSSRRKSISRRTSTSKAKLSLEDQSQKDVAHTSVYVGDS